jgi:mannose-6-phosphate isomerase
MTPRQALDWLTGSALPLWLAHGVEWQSGAFSEDLDPATLRPRSNFRRLRVAARQTYVFAQGAKLGVPHAAEAASLGLAFLRTKARQPDGGYPSRFDLANAPLDAGRDLYDHAFVLLAYAHTGQAADARAVLAYLDAHFIHPEGGLRESVPDALPRRQNPHMHLLEALLAAAEIFADWDYLDRADRLVDLFLDRLLQPGKPALPEYFDAVLQPVRDAGRYVMEPGHHFEWVWLLDEHRRLSAAAGRTPRDTTTASGMLMEFAQAHGVTAKGHISAELWSDGGARPAPVRIWPTTEWLKALSRQGADQVPAGIDALARFFDGVPPGLWCERAEAGVLIRGETCPASSLYHISCAILELRRHIAA